MFLDHDGYSAHHNKHKMVEIFTITNSQLSSQFVESFPPEKLALTLLKIGEETGVEFSRQKKTFGIVGHWNAIVKAHQTLENFFDNESLQCSAQNGEENHSHASLLESDRETSNQNSGQKKPVLIVSNDGKPGRKPGTSVRSPLDNTGVPDPVVLYQYDKKALINQDMLRPSNLLHAFEGSRNTSSDETQKQLVREVQYSNENVQTQTNSDTHENYKSIPDLCDNNEGYHEDSATDVDETYQTNDMTDIKTNKSTVSPKASSLKLTIKVEKTNTDKTISSKRKSKRKSKPVKVTQPLTTELPSQNHLKKTSRKRKPQNTTSKVHKLKQEQVKETIQEEVFKCDLCSYTGTKKSNLKEHKKRKHRTKFTCDVCQKQFGFNKDLNRHKRQVHSEPAHFCDVCQKFYKSKRVYDEHILTHKENYVKPNYACKLCPKSFSTKYVLAAHIKAEHLGMKKSYMCPTCGRSFTQKNSYVMHANVHAGIKPYVCDVCGKAFTYDKSLREHKFMHDNIRRFECTVCSKTFRQTTSLRIHMKVHKESKDYMCTSCGKGFTQKQALLRHERIHSGDKPYICGLCGRSFSDYSIIRRHMMLIHKKDPKDWRGDIISNLKRKKDYYIDGGPGHHVKELKSADDVQDSEKGDKINNITSMGEREGAKSSDSDPLCNNQSEVMKQSVIEGYSLESSNVMDSAESSVQDLSQSHVTLLPPPYSCPATMPNSLTDRNSSAPSPAIPSSSIPLNYSVASAYSANATDASSEHVQDSSLESYHRHWYSSPSSLPAVSIPSGLPPLHSQLTVPSMPGIPVSGDTTHAQLLHAWAYSGYGPYYSSNLPQYSQNTET